MRENKRCQNVERALAQAHAGRQAVEPPPGWSTQVMRTARLAADAGAELEINAQSLFNRLAMGLSFAALVAGVAMWGYLQVFGPDIEYKLVQATVLAKGNLMSWGLAL